MVITNVHKAQEIIEEKLMWAIADAGAYFDKQVKKNISKTDHTLADLARMGHPYARFNTGSVVGAILRGAGKKSQRGWLASKKIHSPSYLVHKQSGGLLDAFYSIDSSEGLTRGKGTKDTSVSAKNMYYKEPDLSWIK